MDEAQPKVWAGIDAGKESHWAHMLDASGEKLLSLYLAPIDAHLDAVTP